MKLYGNFLRCLLLSLMALGHADLSAQAIVLSEPHKGLLRWTYKVIRENPLPLSMPEPLNQCPNWAEYEKQVLWLSDFFAKVAERTDLVELIIKIRDGFYGEDGKLFKEMLLAAATDKSERDSLIRGMKYEKGDIIWPGLDLTWEGIIFKTFLGRIFSVSDKVTFSDRPLKKNMDLLETELQALGMPKSDFSNLNANVEDFHESIIQLLVKLAPRLSDLISFPCELYTKKSLQAINADEVRIVLGKLSLLLKDNKDGIVGMIRQSMPRQ